MARALIAWFSAPAPTICTSTVPAWRMTPAIAPATALGFDRLETFRTSTDVCGDEGVPTVSMLRRAAAGVLRADCTNSAASPAAGRGPAAGSQGVRAERA